MATESMHARQNIASLLNRDDRPALLRNWLPSVIRRGRMSGAAEATLVAAAVLGIVALTSVLAVAHYQGAKQLRLTASGEISR